MATYISKDEYRTVLKQILNLYFKTIYKIMTAVPLLTDMEDINNIY